MSGPTTGNALQWPPAVLAGGVKVAVVVPFREQQPLQNRGQQLKRFTPHMASFLSLIPGSQVALIIVEQSQDNRKFNRGQLLNVGFRLAQKALPGLHSYITHDVDLLPRCILLQFGRSIPTTHSLVVC